MAASQKIKVTLRLSLEERALLDALAAQEQRSCNGILRRLLLNAKRRRTCWPRWRRRSPARMPGGGLPMGKAESQRTDELEARGQPHERRRSDQEVGGDSLEQIAHKHGVDEGQRPRQTGGTTAGRGWEDVDL